MRFVSHRARKQALRALTVSALALAAGAPEVFAQTASPSAAQTAQAQTAQRGPAIEEIVVTARKREENLQSVPLAITAFTSEMIENQGITRLRDVANLTPGLFLNDFGAGTLTAPAIRGLTVLTGGAFSENNVSVFLDGVYMFTSYAIDSSLADIERIEVVKGPVSALYGRNAYSGAINYVTKRPGEEFEGKIELRGGSHSLYGGSFALGGPLIAGKLRGRIAGNYESFGGTFKDDVTDVRFGGHKKRAVQVSLDATPFEALNLFGTVFYSNDFFDQPARIPVASNCGGLPGAAQTQVCGIVPDADDLAPIQSPRPNFKLTGNDREVLNVVLRGNLDVGFGRIESLTGIQNVDIYEYRSFDSGVRQGRAFPLFGQPAGTVNLPAYSGRDWKDRSWSQELRYSTPEDLPVRATLGGFYSSFKRDQQTFFGIDGSAIPAGREVRTGPTAAFAFWITPDGSPSPRDSLILLKDKETSGFGGLEWDVFDKFTVSAEARRSKQEKFINSTRFFPGPISGAPGVDNDGANGTEAEWKFWSYRFTADYQWSDDLLLYASYGKGNKAGGFNVPVPADPADFIYGPEANETFEIGAKATWLDGRLRTNVALFYADLKDIQITALPTDPTRLGAFIRNAAAADAKGFEVEASALLLEGVNVSLGLAYTDPKFKDNSVLVSAAEANACANIASCAARVVTLPGNRRGIDLDAQRLPRASKWMFTGTFDITQPLAGEWNGFFRGDYRYDGKRLSAANGFSQLGSTHMLNLRAGIENDTFSLTVFVDNVLNDQTPLNLGSQTSLANLQAFWQAVYDNKRTWGVVGRMRF
jgi:iron complex outermembrane receptor protein